MWCARLPADCGGGVERSAATGRWGAGLSSGHLRAETTCVQNILRARGRITLRDPRAVTAQVVTLHGHTNVQVVVVRDYAASARSVRRKFAVYGDVDIASLAVELALDRTRITREGR